jgi:hypothetical protein
LKAQIKDANAQIEGFKALDVDGVKKAAEEWKTKYETASKEAEERIASLTRDHALGEYLAGHKFTSQLARDAAFVKLKAANLPLNEGKIVGADDVMAALKKDNPSAFEAPKAGGESFFGTKSATQAAVNTFMNSFLRGTQAEGR